jgi:hypothetical protein
MSRIGAAPGAAVAVSSARARASRKNGTKSRGPKTAEGKARSAQNALKHGMRAQKYVVLPQEDAAAFEVLEAAILAELAPQGALQTLLARRVAVAAWRLERADRLEAEVLEFRSSEGASAGLALIRDGNGTRSFETLMRYRGAAMAEFMRALRTLKALQAQAQSPGAEVLEPQPRQPRAPARAAFPHAPNEPERRSQSSPDPVLDYLLPDQPRLGRTLHEPAAPWLPNEPEPRQQAVLAPGQPNLAPNEPEPSPS